ncbi:hypothetical protein ACOSQ3_015093 [Xanthoceras sorbifolium]
MIKIKPNSSISTFMLQIILVRVNRELRGESSSSSSGAGGSRRRSSGMRPQQTVIDPYKRCPNYNCNTNVTPMWRKGPLGPKTLCNACGIKYKEEEDRKKAIEAASCRSNNQTGSLRDGLYKLDLFYVQPSRIVDHQ